MDEWYFSTPDGGMIGPLPKKELIQQIRSGQLSREAMVCPANGSTWVSISDEPEFSRALRRAPTIVGLTVPTKDKPATVSAPTTKSDDTAAKANRDAPAHPNIATRQEAAQRPPPSQGGLLTPGPPASGKEKRPTPASATPPVASPAEPVAPPADPKPAAKPAPAAAAPAPAPTQPTPTPAAAPHSAPAPAPMPAATSQAPSPPGATQVLGDGLPTELELEQMRGGGAHRLLRGLGLGMTIVGAAVLALGSGDTIFRGGLALALVGIAVVAFARHR